METSLHRELKRQYAEDDAQTEVRLGRYRIDACRDSELIEIQHGSLSAIRDKVQDLLNDGYSLRIVKPIVARRMLVRLNKKNGKEISRRWSPKRRDLLSVFDELIYFTRTFPHPGLVIEVPLVEVEEWRYPGHGKRRRWRKNDFQIQDQFLVKTLECHEFRTARDIALTLPQALPTTFHTGHIAKELGVHRSIAQRMTYCLRHFGSIRQVGKQGNTVLYRIPQKGRLVTRRRTIKKRRLVPKSILVETRDPKTPVAKKKPKKKSAAKIEDGKPKSASKRRKVAKPTKSVPKKSKRTTKSKKTVQLKKGTLKKSTAKKKTPRKRAGKAAR